MNSCTGEYSFIGKANKRAKITYEEAWKGSHKILLSIGFSKSLTNARIPCTEIKRYPVVARWRNDVDFTAAGIFCFQPYCVTGESDPPANPLICPQFCLRFNDLDNIGVTGRHYSGFVMMGIQAFNHKNKEVLSKEDCTEFNYRWLTETLRIDPDEITFTEDVWAGGGNLGPAIEYFVGGLEIGNMVFMQYKTSSDRSLIELPVKVIDVGIGLERIPWLINGTPTSYTETFSTSYDFLCSQLGLRKEHNEIWNKFAPYSCRLNVDEAENISDIWKNIAQKVGLSVEALHSSIAPTRDAFILLDHTRTVMMAIEDGALPSNIGGGGNVRNVLRRSFALLHKNGWWEKIGMDGMIKLFDIHRQSLASIYGPFQEHKSFRKIIEIEYDRWRSTDEVQQKKVTKLIKKGKGKLSINDWVVAVSSWGVPADKVAELTKQQVPANLYQEIASRQEKMTKIADEILYDTNSYEETENLYYKDTKLLEFSAKIIDVLENKQEKMEPNILILNISAFYPTSGGQVSDIGTIKIGDETYEVEECQRIGKCVLHFLNKPLINQKPKEYYKVNKLMKKK